MTYKVFVDDNFHFMDESKRHEFDEFPTLDAAIGASKQIVDGYLVSACESGMTADALFESYASFGQDAFVRAAPGSSLLEPPDGSPNFLLDAPAAVDSKALATLTVHTFRDVYRAGHRGERQYKSFAKDQTQIRFPTLRLTGS